MAASPVKPDDFKAVIPAANSNLCEKLLAVLIKLPTLIWQFFSWMMNSDGTPTDDFKSWLGVAVGQIAPPTSVSATDGTFTDHVNVTWAPVAGATYYEVFRGTVNDPSASTSIGNPTEASFSDATATANQTYWYFIKARNATDTSGFSQGDSGFTDTSGGGGGGSSGNREFSGNGTWTVPAGVTAIQVEAWGASGGGGGSSAVWSVATTPFYAGGGGASGEYIKVVTIPVTPAETLEIVIGAPGAAGDGTGADLSAGGDGGPSIIRRSSTDLVSAHGGGGGGKGSVYGYNGVGGTGGSGGSASAGSVNTQTAGNNGASSAAASYPPPAGGAGGAGVSGGTAGGAGGSNSDGQAGGRGKLKITWPG